MLRWYRTDPLREHYFDRLGTDGLRPRPVLIMLVTLAVAVWSTTMMALAAGLLYFFPAQWMPLSVPLIAAGALLYITTELRFGAAWARRWVLAGVPVLTIGHLVLHWQAYLLHDKVMVLMLRHGVYTREPEIGFSPVPGLLAGALLFGFTWFALTHRDATDAASAQPPADAANPYQKVLTEMAVLDEVNADDQELAERMRAQTEER